MFGNQRPVAPWADHNWWGQYDTAADLPNVAGARLQITEVQAGDMAFCLADSTIYVCTTPTAGAAVWVAVGTGSADAGFFLEEVSGFSNTAYYEDQSGAITGSATMSSVVLARLKHGAGTGLIEVAHGNFNSAGVGGWQVGKDGTRFKHYITDGTPTQVENAVEANFSTPSFAADFSSGTHVLIGQTYDGTSSRLYINGRLQNVRTPGGAGFTPSGSTYKWGVIAFQLLDPFQGGICGAAVDESNVWSEDEMFDYWLAVKDAVDVVDGGLGWEHLWSLKGEAAIPATIADTGTGTARNLTLVGALTLATHRYDWYRY